MDGSPANACPYMLVRSLGEGTTGKVKLAIERATDRQCAIKIISKSLFERKPHLQVKIQREIALMRLVDHPHLLKLIDVLESPSNLYIVLEYASRGELFDYLVEHRSLSDEEAAFLSKQMQHRFSGFQQSTNSVNQAQQETLISKFGDQAKRK